MSSPAASTIDPVYTSGAPYSRELYKPGTDRRMVEAAAATGHDLVTVLIRGIKWCKANPRGGEFDQTLPADFDEQIMAAGDDEAAIRSARRKAIETHGVDIYPDGSDAIVLKGVTLQNALVSGEDIEPIIAELVETGESTAAHPDGGLVYVVLPAAAAASLWPKRNEDLGDGGIDVHERAKQYGCMLLQADNGKWASFDADDAAATHDVDQPGIALWNTPGEALEEWLLD